MRVIAGEFRRRRLQTLPGEEIRPTPDRLREALFNILTPQIEGSLFVDAYAGSGAVGIEALSRGAKKVVLIERRRSAVQLIRSNLESLAITHRVQVLTGRALDFLAQHASDLVFLDPPYSMEREYEAALDLVGRQKPRLTIVQHSIRLGLRNNYNAVWRLRTVRQGDNVLSFFAPRDEREFN